MNFWTPVDADLIKETHVGRLHFEDQDRDALELRRNGLASGQYLPLCG